MFCKVESEDVGRLYGVCLAMLALPIQVHERKGDGRGAIHYKRTFKLINTYKKMQMELDF